MASIEQQIIETWRAHNRMMMFILDHIPDDALKATLSSRGGRDIGRQFAHIHMVRVWHAEASNKKSVKGLATFEDGKSPDKKELLRALEQSGKAIESYLLRMIEKTGTVDNFKRSAVPILGYFISHEAHHRGSIMLILKQTDFKIPERLRWGIWDWNKFKDLKMNSADNQMKMNEILNAVLMLLIPKEARP